MPFEVRYGNPYAPGVGASIFEGAKKETEFARMIEVNRLNQSAQQLELEKANQAIRRDQQDIDNEYRSQIAAQEQANTDRALAMKERQETEQSRQFNADLTQKQQWAKIQSDQNEWARKKYDREENQQVQEQLNQIVSFGGVKADSGTEQPEGSVLYRALDGNNYFVPKDELNGIGKYKRQREIDEDVALDKMKQADDYRVQKEQRTLSQKELESYIADQNTAIKDKNDAISDARKAIDKLDVNIDLTDEQKAAKKKELNERIKNFENDIALRRWNIDKSKDPALGASFNFLGNLMLDYNKNPERYPALSKDYINMLPQLTNALRLGSLDERRKAKAYAQKLSSLINSSEIALK